MYNLYALYHCSEAFFSCSMKILYSKQILLYKTKVECFALMNVFILHLKLFNEMHFKTLQSLHVFILCIYDTFQVI